MSYLEFAKKALVRLQQWDEAKAEKMLAESYERLATIYVPGALEYAKEYLPELDAAWLQALEDIDKAYARKNMRAFTDALSQHEEICKKIFEAYRRDELAI